MSPVTDENTFDDLEFDLTGPLPSGVTVLEASAGTGKTYTIAALAARFVADGHRLDELLLVTFTRMATGELRERVRERLVSSEAALTRVLDGAELDHPDEIERLLSTGSREELQHRRERLAAAVSNFDAATIATTHGFCQEVLGELGTLGDLEPDVEFAEDVDDLIEEVVDDLYLRRFLTADDAPFDRKQAGQIARIAIANPTAAVHPLTARDDSVEAMRRRLAEAARKELERRKRQLAVMTYDDLLTRLRAALAGPNGPAAAVRLRRRYRVVLIDEFQDTDPIQWEIVSRAFGGGTTLVLIADPKQAIYAFRGADVYAYLKAAGSASARRTLRVNRRSDQPLLDAFDALFGNAKLGHAGIAYRQVRAAEGHQQARLIGDGLAPLRIRVVERDQPSVTLTGGGAAEATSSRSTVAKDVAADIVALLSSEAKIDTEPVKPGDIAVLVRSNRNAALIHDELAAAGVPAVINGGSSVFGTEAARDWLRVLQGLERPAYSARARSAALTPLIGWSAERVATAGEAELEELHQRLHTWARVLRLQGMAALAETIGVSEGLAARMLGLEGGERRLTDMHHVAQLLHGAASSEQLGTAALTTWLRQRIAEAEREGGNDELTRRLESDADAVQVLTIHRSKGLQFPIVYAPFLWERGFMSDRSEPVYFHDPDAGEERAIDVALYGSAYRTHLEQHLIEERGEDLRLMYVALTRAKHRVVVWWVGSYNNPDSPLTRLLFSRDADGNIAPKGGKRQSDEAVLARLKEIAAAVPDGVIDVATARLDELPASWSGAEEPDVELAAATFGRTLDGRWRRTSYSDITAGAHELWVASEPEVDVLSDEPSGESVGLPARTVPAKEVPSLLGSMPVGARIGTFVHRLFEASDFGAEDLKGEVAARIEELQVSRRLEIGDPLVVAAGLAAAIETPFDGDLIRLRDLARGDRLDELEFELPLAGGDDPDGSVTVAAIAAVLRAGLPADDPLAGYAARLADPTLRRDVRGYLTGSIDLVLRLADGRYAIADYKTNWLGAPDDAGELSVWDYRPEALAAEMERAHYGLQALLYLVALHRFLRWRVPDYSPERKLGGVHYLFVRGMVGDSTPAIAGRRCGVFSWHPPAAAVVALSDALDGRRS